MYLVALVGLEGDIENDPKLLNDEGDDSGIDV